MPAIRTWYQANIHKLVKKKYRYWEYWLQVYTIRLIHVRSLSDTVCIPSPSAGLTLMSMFRPDAVLLYICKEDSKMVEETFLSSIQPGSGECTSCITNQAKKKCHWKFSTKKVAEGLLASADIEIQA
jgi:hypothetical protein